MGLQVDFTEIVAEWSPVGLIVTVTSEAEPVGPVSKLPTTCPPTLIESEQFGGAALSRRVTLYSPVFFTGWMLVATT